MSVRGDVVMVIGLALSGTLQASAAVHAYDIGQIWPILFFVGSAALMFVGAATFWIQGARDERGEIPLMDAPKLKTLKQRLDHRPVLGRLLDCIQ